MLHAESYALWNAAMCVSALPLGGCLAGLPTPQARRLVLCGAVCTAAGLAAAAQATGQAARMGMMATLPACVLMCFGMHGARACLRGGLMTLCASLLTGGAATALAGMGVPAAGAMGMAAALAALVQLLVRLVPSALCDVRQVELRYGERSVLMPAMLDTGNLLRDPVTGQAVLVAPHRAVAGLFDGACDLLQLRSLPLGFRLLSVHTAAGAALMPLFKPDKCIVYVNGAPTEAQLLVAVAGRGYGGVHALVPLGAVEQRG